MSLRSELQAHLNDLQRQHDALTEKIAAAQSLLGTLPSTAPTNGHAPTRTLTVGSRSTPHTLARREAVLAALTDRPMTSAELIAALPAYPRQEVYRTLYSLKRGKVVTQRGDGQFRVRYHHYTP